MAIATILTQEMIGRYTAAGFWGDRIWPDYIDKAADEDPARTAIIDERGRLAYGDFRRIVNRTAVRLLQAGIGREERVALHLPNWREFIVMRFALARIGAISVPVPIDWQAKEVQYVLAATEAAALVIPAKFGSRDFVQEHRDMMSSLPALRLRILAGADTPPAGWESLQSWMDDTADISEQEEKLYASQPGANDVDIIVSTSGSSAAPKLVVRTPNCFLATTRQFVEHRGRLGRNDVIAGLAPITRGMGYYIGVASAVMAGSTMALLEKFSPEAALDWLASTGATVAVAVPTQIIKMLQVKEFGQYKFGSLRMIVNGGAAIPPGVAREAEERFGCVILSAYGSVEGATPACTAPEDPAEMRYTTVGRIMPGMELRAVDEDGKVMPAGQAGEIVYRGPGLSLGFWRNPDAYRELLDENGWFRTGDLGVIDDQGFLRIVGRKKEIIIRGGINISPAEVEGLLHECPGVKQVAIVKMPDPVLGERCCAYVVADSGFELNVPVLATFLGSRKVAKYKFPERVEVREQLPMTPDGGKVLRRALEEDILHILGQEAARQ